MEFYSELPYEDFSYYNTPSTHEVGGSILTGILMFYLIILSMAGVCTICQNVPSGRAWRNGTSEK